MAGQPRTRARRASRLPAQATPVGPNAPTPVHDAKREFAEGIERVWETARGANYLAVRNGTGSPRIIERAARDLVDWLHEVRSDLAARRHASDVSAWARCEALALQLY